MMQASARLAVMYRPISAPRAENVTLVSLPSAHLIIVRMEVMDASGVGGRGLYQHPRGSGLVDGSHHLGGRGLMHHVSDTSDAVQSALFDLGVQPGRMPLKVSDTIVLGDDYDRPHFASS
jgi:hypothetical protein